VNKLELQAAFKGMLTALVVIFLVNFVAEASSPVVGWDTALVSAANFAFYLIGLPVAIFIYAVHRALIAYRVRRYRKVLKNND
jgi:sterol desaturase/sphingolipid hydroxylase (fatty acid hydroxylase superfamily)